ncbi:MAG: hypothetical protein P8J87_15195, partial [Verrucomicrobiales bacterium]|nr:hypothetical protein [Verrucomicrobiales bacterium]
MRADLVAVVLAVMGVGTGIAEARLGETAEECGVRYGEVVGTYPASLKGSDDEAVHFLKDYFHFFVEFREGKAWSIKVKKRGLRTSERDKILEAEGVLFEGPEKYGGKSFWISSRGTVHAIEMELGRVRTLQIMTRDFVKAQAKAQEKR